MTACAVITISCRLPSVNNHAASQISLSRYSGSQAGLAYTPIHSGRAAVQRQAVGSDVASC